jgi:hypothetical protein
LIAGGEHGRLNAVGKAISIQNKVISQSSWFCFHNAIFKENASEKLACPTSNEAFGVARYVNQASRALSSPTRLTNALV